MTSDTKEDVFEPEIEAKFDIPLGIDAGDLVKRVVRIALAEGWRVVGDNFEALKFEYFDTPELALYHNGETFRRVSGFPATSKPKSQHRYDLKVGSIENRFEKKHWSHRLYTPNELVALVAPECSYRNLITSAYADTNHVKKFLEREGTAIEVTYDFFSVREGTAFKELELEILKGNDVAAWRELSERVKEELGLTPITVQKYSRVIEGMPKYAEWVEGIKNG